MIRSTVLALVVALALVTPRSVSAGIGDQPLRTLCSSPTMDRCVSILTWDARSEFLGTYSGTDLWRWVAAADVEVFGGGFTDEPFLLSFLVDYTGNRDYVTLSGRLPSVGRHTLTQNDAPYGSAFVTSPASIFHVVLGSGNVCITGDPDRPCYEVPEPGSLLLLASGLGVLGVVGWRRRRPAA